MKALMNTEYKTFLKEIKERIHKAQYDAFKAVNKELITLYWDIGKSIVGKQNKLGWGKAIVETLAKDLQKEFPGIQGVFRPKSMEYAAVLLGLQGQSKTPANGWRN